MNAASGRLSTWTTLAMVLIVAVAALVLDACAREPTPAAASPPTIAPATKPPQRAAQLANPASTHCGEVGGRFAIEKNPAGGEFGVCYFEDNHQCEEWALLRGECPVGGRRITGYATAAGRFCAITGGQYTDVTGNDAADEHGNCILPGGRKCEAEAYYRGNCGR